MNQMWFRRWCYSSRSEFASRKIAQKTPDNSNKDALEEGKEKDSVQKEVEEIQRVLEETDNDTHFKSKENLLFCSEGPGCPGDGKGPWDGLGDMTKTKVTRDLTDSNVQTPSGRITCELEVAQHLLTTFSTRQWSKQHINMKINKVVVMYLDTGEIKLWS